MSLTSYRHGKRWINSNSLSSLSSFHTNGDVTSGTAGTLSAGCAGCADFLGGILYNRRKSIAALAHVMKRDKFTFFLQNLGDDINSRRQIATVMSWQLYKVYKKTLNQNQPMVSRWGRSLYYGPLAAFLDFRQFSQRSVLPCLAFDCIRFVSFRSVSFRLFFCQNLSSVNQPLNWNKSLNEKRLRNSDKIKFRVTRNEEFIVFPNDRNGPVYPAVRFTVTEVDIDAVHNLKLWHKEVNATTPTAPTRVISA